MQFQPLNLSPKKLFLLDSFGALLSALLSAVFPLVIVIWFEEHVGMPAPILYCLMALSLTYATYSLSSAWYFDRHRVFGFN